MVTNGVLEKIEEDKKAFQQRFSSDSHKRNYADSP